MKRGGYEKGKDTVGRKVRDSAQAYNGSRMCRELEGQKRKGRPAIYPRGQVISILRSAASDMMMRIRTVCLNKLLSR